MKHPFRRLAAAICTLALCLTSVSALSVEQAIDLLEKNYVDKLPAAAYEAETLDELFNAVGDPYTYYMSAADYEEFTAEVESENVVTGIGAGIEYTANGIRITMLLDGGGAKDAGLQIDDYIIAADGVSCVPAAEAHRSLIVGEAGTYVTLTVRHKDGTVKDYRIERRTIAIHNTKVTIADGVGVIDCDSFGSQTETYFYDGVSANEENADLWVVDLRSNLGGLADAAVGSLGIFTGYGPKLYYRLADGSSFYTVYLADKLTDKPVIVLVNGHSASASEILSGGILAENAGIVIGPRTYGKGTAQILLDKNEYPELFDGDSVKVTAYRFYCSDGNTTDRIGVLPTLLVEDAYVEPIAALLKASRPDSGNYLRFTLNGSVFYVDTDTAMSAENMDAFRALLAAIPASVAVYCASDGAEIPLDAALAARYLNIEIEQRGFLDVDSSPYAMQINTLAAYGLLSGDGSGHYRPGSLLTRAELASMLAQALNVTGGASMGFSDVPDGCWFTGDINAVASLGFMNGVADGRFDPDGELTQEQLITVMGRLTRFLNFHADDFALELTDEDLSDAALAPFHAWARTGAVVLTDYAGNMLYTHLSEIDPGAPVTREQAAATLYQILKTLGILSH